MKYGTLMKLLVYGNHRRITVLTGEVAPVPSGKKWLMLGGIIYHVTATPSGLAVVNKINPAYATSGTTFITFIDTAFITTVYPLFNNAASVAANGAMSGQFGIYILTDSEQFSFAGGAGSFAKIDVLEVEDA